MARVAAANGIGSRRNRGELGRDFCAALMPTRLDAAGLDHVVRADWRKAEIALRFAGIGRDTVDLLEGQPGIVERLTYRVHGEAHGRAGQPDTDLGLPDACYICLACQSHVRPLSRKEETTRRPAPRK